MNLAERNARQEGYNERLLGVALLGERLGHWRVAKVDNANPMYGIRVHVRDDEGNLFGMRTEEGRLTCFFPYVDIKRPGWSASVGVSDISFYRTSLTKPEASASLERPTEKLVADVMRRFVEPGKPLAAAIRAEAARREESRGRLENVAEQLRAMGYEPRLGSSYHDAEAYAPGKPHLSFNCDASIRPERVSLPLENLQTFLGLLGG